MRDDDWELAALARHLGEDPLCPRSRFWRSVLVGFAIGAIAAGGHAVWRRCVHHEAAPPPARHTPPPERGLDQRPGDAEPAWRWSHVRPASEAAKAS